MTPSADFLIIPSDVHRFIIVCQLVVVCAVVPPDVLIFEAHSWSFARVSDMRDAGSAGFATDAKNAPHRELFSTMMQHGSMERFG
jgi:hypothetical protein